MAVLKVKDQVYMSTLSDFPSDALKLDVPPGNYELRAHEGGYVFLKQGVNINEVKIIKVFNFRDGEYGLSGTFYGGDSRDVEQLRLFNDHFWRYVDWNYEDMESFYEDDYEYDYSHDDGFEDETGDYIDYYESEDYYPESTDSEVEEGFDDKYPDAWMDRVNYRKAILAEAAAKEPPRKRRLIQLPEFHNLPIILYLYKPVQNTRNVDLKLLQTHIKDDILVWEVQENGDAIGCVVKTPFFHNMIGEAGIAVYESATAFGNFEPNVAYAIDEDVFQPHKDYTCKINPCNCRTIYPNVPWRRGTKQK